MKQLLKNAKIYDGTGSAPFKGDVLIEDDRIVKVGETIAEDADVVWDLKGKSLAPGFIDAHSHNDWFAIKKDPLPYFAPFLRQGISTFVTGNCGISAIGFEPDCPHMDVISTLFPKQIRPSFLNTKLSIILLEGKSFSPVIELQEHRR